MPKALEHWETVGNGVQKVAGVDIYHSRLDAGGGYQFAYQLEGVVVVVLPSGELWSATGDEALRRADDLEQLADEISRGTAALWGRGKAGVTGVEVVVYFGTHRAYCRFAGLTGLAAVLRRLGEAAVRFGQVVQFGEVSR